MKELTVETAKELLHKNMQNVNLRRHCYAVGKTLRAFHDYYVLNGVKKEGMDLGNLTTDQWEIVGILHDSDWELTTNDPNNHTIMLLDWLKEYNAPEEILNVFRSHNTRHTHLRELKTLLEWTLECCDELTGFIVAVALVQPDKKLSSVTLESVLKKFKQKEFARAVDRSQIAQCEEKLGIVLTDFVGVALKAMQDNSDLMGL